MSIHTYSLYPQQHHTQMAPQKTQNYFHTALVSVTSLACDSRSCSPLFSVCPLPQSGAVFSRPVGRRDEGRPHERPSPLSPSHPLPFLGEVHQHPLSAPLSLNLFQASADTIQTTCGDFCSPTRRFSIRLRSPCKGNEGPLLMRFDECPLFTQVKL